MPDIKILRRPEVERQTQLSKASIYRQMHAGTFPKPVQLGERAVGWRLSEIDEWLDTRKRASFDREG